MALDQIILAKAELYPTCHWPTGRKCQRYRSSIHTALDFTLPIVPAITKMYIKKERIKPREQLF